MSTVASWTYPSPWRENLPLVSLLPREFLKATLMVASSYSFRPLEGIQCDEDVRSLGEEREKDKKKIDKFVLGTEEKHRSLCLQRSIGTYNK